VETAEYFSRTVGQKTQLVPRRTWQKKRFALIATGTSDTTQEHARALLTADEVRRIGTDEALVITGNRKPLLVRKYRYTLPPQPGAASGLGPARSTLLAAPPPAAPAATNEETPVEPARKPALPPPCPKS
jgi:type IV secretory pathway TraG/TraD family ATPase VirD4